MLVYLKVDRGPFEGVAPPERPGEDASVAHLTQFTAARVSGLRGVGEELGLGLALGSHPQDTRPALPSMHRDVARDEPFVTTFRVQDSRLRLELQLEPVWG